MSIISSTHSTSSSSSAELKLPPEWTPPYSDSPLPPSYDRRLHTGEQRLLFNDGGRFAFLHAGVYTKSTKRKDIMISLLDQEPDAERPLYGRNAKICGSVGVGYKPSEISRVTVKVEGNLKTGLPDWYSDIFEVISLTSILWSRDTNTNSKLPLPPIPPSMPFRFRLPYIYKTPSRDGSNMIYSALPPNFNVENMKVLMFKAVVEYRIVVEVELLKGFLNKRSSLIIPFSYFPRSHPPYPTLTPPDTFLGTLKVSPEEWAQHTSIMVSRLKNVEPIYVNIVLPKGSIYPLSVPLPFHIQLTSSHSHSQSLTQFTSNPTQTKITVTLLRKFGAEVRGREAWDTSEIGHGALKIVEGLGVGVGILAWEGLVHFSSSCGQVLPTFSAGQIYIRDFIVVHITPDDTVNSPFNDHKQFIPIRLVSDHFDGMGMGDLSG